jgi:hypothetical protein
MFLMLLGPLEIHEYGLQASGDARRYRPIRDYAQG